VLYVLLHERRVNRISNEVFSKYKHRDFQFRIFTPNDLNSLKKLLDRQNPADLKYFNPHGFSDHEIQKTFQNPAFIMMGAFKDSDLVGYFFLRFFWNKKCFVGRLVDSKYQAKGIGKVMNDIMYNIAWGSGFRCLSTISKNNKAVMTAHAKNKTMRVLKKLENDYLLVEFVEPDKRELNK